MKIDVKIGVPFTSIIDDFSYKIECTRNEGVHTLIVISDNTNLTNEKMFLKLSCILTLSLAIVTFKVSLVTFDHHSSHIEEYNE